MAITAAAAPHAAATRRPGKPQCQCHRLDILAGAGTGQAVGPLSRVHGSAFWTLGDSGLFRAAVAVMTAVWTVLAWSRHPGHDRVLDVARVMASR